MIFVGGNPVLLDDLKKGYSALLLTEKTLQAPTMLRPPLRHCSSLPSPLRCCPCLRLLKEFTWAVERGLGGYGCVTTVLGNNPAADTKCIVNQQHRFHDLFQCDVCSCSFGETKGYYQPGC